MQALLAFALLVAAPFTASARAQGPGALDFTFIDTLMGSYLAANPAAPGAAVLLQVHGQVVFERYYGAYAPNTALPIASATKWVTTAAVLAAQERGLVELDDPVGGYEAAFATPQLSTITLRQCVSHTSGLPGISSATNNGQLTLAQAVAQIAAEGPRTNALGQPIPPGSDFCYGGVSMHVAGRALEVASGLAYRELLAAWITGPLGMAQTAFPPQQGANPLVAGGLWSTARDYARFVEMLRNGGLHAGVAVLSAASVDELLRDATQAVPVTCTPQGLEPATRYGLGCWIDVPAVNGSALQASSPGAFGFTPWVDRGRGLAGVIAIQHLFAEFEPTARLIQERVRAELDASAGFASEVCSSTTVSCPCANPGDEGEGCRNASGRGSRLLAFGSPSRAADDLYLHTTGVPAQRSGLIFMGAQALALPLDNGVRCVGGNLLRFERRLSSPGGSFLEGPIVSLAAQRFANGGGLDVGQTLLFQAWHRDFPGACGAASNLSNAIAVTFAP